MAQLGLAERPTRELQERRGALGDGLGGRRDGAGISSERTAALATPEHSVADRERPGTGRVVDETSSFYSANDEIAGTTGHSPRPG